MVDTIEQDLLRTAMRSEMEAINLYIQLSNRSKSHKLKEVYLHVIEEEKAHLARLVEELRHLHGEEQ